jgi:O-antigen ligase
MREIVVLLIMISGTWASLFYPPHWALWTYWWIAFFRPQDWAYTDILTNINFSAAIGLVYIFKSLVRVNIRDITSPFALSLIIMMATGGFAHLNAYNRDVSLDSLAQFSILTTIIVLALGVISTYELFSRSIYLICGLVTFHTAKAGLGILVAGSGSVGDGLGGYMPDNNATGLISAFMIPVIYACGRSLMLIYPRVNAYIGTMFAVIITLNCATVVFTGSRGAFLTMATALAILVVFSKRKLMLTSLGFLLFFLIISTNTIVTDKYKQRVESISEYQVEGGDESIHSRLHFWKMAVNIFLDNPQGVGLRNFEYAYPAYDTSNGIYGFQRPVHNAHLQILTEIGLVGFTAWIFSFIYLVRRLYVLWRSTLGGRDQEAVSANIFASSFIATISSFFVGSSFGNYAYNDLFWTIAGISATLIKLKSINENSSNSRT